METTTTRNLRECINRDAVDRNGKKIGKIYDIYVDEDSRQPEWLAITSGLFGHRVSFVPIRLVSFGGEELIVDDEADHVKDAPSVDADGKLSPEEEDQLYSHYRTGDTERRSDSVLPDERTDTDWSAAAMDIDRPGGETDTAMTRSEELPDLDKVRRPTGKARLKKWVETEHRQFTVPVRREKANVVAEPITNENRDPAMSGPDKRENEHEVELNEEEVVVNKKTVPKERVRLEAETETGQKLVDVDLKKERLDIESRDRTVNR